jgi:hypothetical protein
MSVQIRIKPADIYRIAAEAGRDPRTVRAVLEGKGGMLSQGAVYEAANRLGIILPAPQRV